ncbi:MAG: hypothetical protein MJ134_00365 [Lachnospiraceae bacterium]|nr:hypothetical protein [Lachnospiraceae bacterium]
MNKVEIENVILDMANNKIQYIKSNGCVAPGHNGPYNDTERPLRNSAHWICTYSYLYRKTANELYKEMVQILADYLLKSDNYSENGTVIYRDNKLSDYTNGIIGPAWIIEGLIEAAKILHDDKYYIKAKALFKLEVFDEKLKLWKIVDVDNKIVSIDYVYNHQLWFAAAGSLICDYRYDADIDNDINLFLDNYKKNLIVQPSGLLYHQVNYDYSKGGYLKKYIKGVLCDFSVGKQLASQNELQRGYQLFDLYGLAVLYERYSAKEIFRDKRIKKAVKYAVNKRNIKRLISKGINKYGFPYNSPGYEYGYVAYTLLKEVSQETEAYLYETILQYFYDPDKKGMYRNTADPETLSARIYELTRYLEKREV